MSSPPKSSGLPYFALFIIGLILAVGGFYFSLNVHLAIFESLAEKGLPLDFGKTLSVIGVFIILLPVINLFYIAPLAQAISERNSDLERTFTEAEQLKAQMEKMRTEYEQRLVATEADARAQIQAQISEAQKLRQTLMADASSRADALVKEAQEKIGQERDRIVNEIRVSVVDLTLMAAEKVVGENMDSEKNRRLVTEFIDRVEVAR